MKSRVVCFVWAAVLAGTGHGTARAADLSLGSWTFSWNEHAQINVSVPVSNNGATDSGPLLITLWATNDPRGSTAVTSGFRLVQVLEDGIPAMSSREINTGFQDHVEQPDAGTTYNIAVVVEEDSFDAPATLVSFASRQLTFPLPEAPTQAEIRRRVASAVPCGALFVQFSLVTFLGLCLTKWVTRGRRRPGWPRPSR